MILVTGGNGFQGIPLCEHLAALGQEVLSVARHPLQSPNYLSARADVTEPGLMADIFKQYPIKAVIHLVSLLASKSSNNPDQAVRVNVIGTLNMLEICKQMGVKRFIYGSSYNAVGYYPHSAGAVDENTEPLPTSFYGETKRFIEKMGVRYAELNGLEFVSGRLSILIGPGEPSPTSAWRSNIYNLLESGGEIAFTFAPGEILPLADVRDTAASLALLALAEKPQHSIYNLPCESMSCEALAGLVQQTGQDIQLSFGTRKLDDNPALVNSNRLKQEFNYQPVPLAKRLQEHREELRKCL